MKEKKITNQPQSIIYFQKQSVFLFLHPNKSQLDISCSKLPICEIDDLNTSDMMYFLEDIFITFLKGS